MYAVLLLAVLVFVTISGNAGAKDTGKFRDMRELCAIFTGFYSVMFVMLANNGFGRGGTIFTLADVYLVFTSPVSQTRVLLYGLFRQLGTSLILGLFLAFQYSWMRNQYGISPGILLLIMLGYAAVVFLGQITAMVIYSFTSASETKRRAAKTVFYTVVAAFALYIAAYALSGGANAPGRLVQAANGGVARLFPVGGWLGRAVYGLITGDTANVFTGVGLCGAFFAILITLVIKLNPDYYEDVIRSTEATHLAITAKKEGIVGDAAPANVRLGKTGIGKGFGADVFYYKHKLENRRSRLFILSPSALVWAAVTVLFALFMRNYGIASIFIFSTYMQIFSVALGRLNKELLKPFVYLVPEPPFKKLLQCTCEMFLPAVLEAAVIYVPVALIIKMSALDTVFCIAARVSFSMLFCAGNVAIARIWSGANKVFGVLLYMLTMALISVPGVALAVLLSSTVTIISANITILISLIACNIPVSLLVFYACRNMLSYSELNNG